MDRSVRKACLFDWLWFLVWGIASSLWCWTAAGQLGATFDEPIYVVRGLEGWRTGSHQRLLQLGTMPLPADLHTLPLYLWERWQGDRLDPLADLERLLPWARVGTLIFWWLLLVYGRLAGRQLAGPWGGRLAVALLACEPTLLAHACLATTDIAVTACLLALVYHFRTARTAGWSRRIGLPALWFAAAVLAKASGLVFGVLCLFVVEVERLLQERIAKADSEPAPGGQTTGPQKPRFTPTLRSVLLSLCSSFRRDLGQIVILGLILTCVYCGCDWKSEPSFVEWAHHLPEGPTARAMVWLSENLCIFSNAAEGLARQVKHNVKGHGAYILGEAAPRAFWYYFPVALTIKLSVPLLLLPVILGVIRPRALFNWAFLAALALLLFSVTCRVQIGVRLILPLIAFAIVGLAAAAVEACRTGDVPSRLLPRLIPHSLTVLLSAAVLWTGLAAIQVWPHGLCYTNALWGGTEQGYLLLSDSNYDWGQGLKELAAWEQKHPDAPVAVWYFGTDPALQRLPLEELSSSVACLPNKAAVEARLRGHYLAASTTLLYGSLLSTLRPEDPAAESYRQIVTCLHNRRPVDRTMTYLIYDFTVDEKDAASTTASRQVTSGK